MSPARSGGISAFRVCGRRGSDRQVQGKAGELLLEVDEGDLSVLVPADGAFHNLHALGRQVGDGGVHVLHLEGDVARLGMAELWYQCDA